MSGGGWEIQGNMEEGNDLKKFFLKNNSLILLSTEVLSR